MTATNAARAFSLSGRRRERAAGERLAMLFEDHGRLVYGVCRLMLRDPVEAEDAAQQTFLSAYRALLGGQEPREPSAWLGTIARNECRTRLRARRTEPLTLVREPLGEDLQHEVDRRDEIHALCAALAELPSQQRDAIVLREFYGLSYAEVGSALGLSGSAVESVIFRSRKRLQDQLRPARSALGVLTLPLSLRESLAQLLPGFGGGGGASAGAGVAVVAKLASAPVAAKVAAAALAVGAAGTVAGMERTHARRHPRPPVPPARATVSRAPAVRQVSARVAPAPVAHPVALVTRKPMAVTPSHEAASEVEHGSTQPQEPTRSFEGTDGGSGHESSGPGPSSGESGSEDGHSRSGDSGSGRDSGHSGSDGSGSGESESEHSGDPGG